MRILDISSILLCCYASLAAAATEETPAPCTIISPRTGSHYNLLPMAVVLPEEGKYKKDSRNESWHARGWDYGSNFTLNFCAPVVEKLEDVVGVKESLWRNVSAYYEKDGKTFSIGYVGPQTPSISSQLTIAQASISRAYLPRSKTRDELYRWVTMRRRSSKERNH